MMPVFPLSQFSLASFNVHSKIIQIDVLVNISANLICSLLSSF